MKISSRKWFQFSILGPVILAPLLFMTGLFFGRQTRQGIGVPTKLIHKETTRPLSPEEREEAKAFDADLEKQCQTDHDECEHAKKMMVLQAQVRLAEWGYGMKFTAEADVETIGAIRVYQQRNGLPATGKLDGLTVVRMDADEKSVAIYPFTLPPFYFQEKLSGSFLATGVYRDTSTGETSGPIQIECDQDLRLCFEEESTTLTPNVSKMLVKQWTSDRIVAEEVAYCYSNQLTIERGSKTVVHASVKTRDDEACKSFEKLIKTRMAGIYSEELVDGVHAQIERNKTRSAAVSRVKLFSGLAQPLINPVPKSSR